ncbi:MAG: DUF3570 domain-containing protein [Methylococcales bacterium]|nr:DUF3570 domain-containing protein [Methylococcales bacterium]
MAVTKRVTAAARLSAAALALPGLMPSAEAGRVEESYQADFQYGHYAESDQRMSVDIYQLHGAVPIGEAMTVSANLVRDVVSGASPMFNIKQRDGKPGQVLTGASIRDQRDAASGSLSYAFDPVTATLGGGYSAEDDYISRYVTGQLSYEFNHKLSTLTLAGSVAFDQIEPTGLNLKENKSNQQYLLGWSQVIDKNTLLKLNATFGYQEGFLSDPYKSVFFDGRGLLADTRPTRRYQWAWLGQLVRYFKPLNQAAWHLDYRFYTDSWDIDSHTLEMSWHQPLFEGWMLVPRLRYYSQNQAEFYQAFFSADDSVNRFSSDYRMAGFGALSGGVKLTREWLAPGSLDSLKLQVGFDYYDRKAAYQLAGDNAGDFADYHAYTVTASVQVRF